MGLDPHVIVLFGATGNLARRKLLPGLLHLAQVGLLPECRIVGTALDELERSGRETALVTLCIGAGMGTATIIERV